MEDARRIAHGLISRSMSHGELASYEPPSADLGRLVSEELQSESEGESQENSGARDYWGTTNDVEWRVRVKKVAAIQVTLTSDGMGNASENDFDAWGSFVAQNIDEATGLDIEIDQARYGAGGADRIDGASDEQRETIREALSALWERWCSEGAPGTTA